MSDRFTVTRTLSDEQVEATIEGYHSFIDEIEALLAGDPTD